MIGGMGYKRGPKLTPDTKSPLSVEDRWRADLEREAEQRRRKAGYMRKSKAKRTGSRAA